MKILKSNENISLNYINMFSADYKYVLKIHIYLMTF